MAGLGRAGGLTCRSCPAPDQLTPLIDSLARFLERCSYPPELLPLGMRKSGKHSSNRIL